MEFTREKRFAVKIYEKYASLEEFLLILRILMLSILQEKLDEHKKYITKSLKCLIKVFNLTSKTLSILTTILILETMQEKSLSMKRLNKVSK